MTGPDIVKGECRHCAGHLEFPAEAAGETIACPHCGRMTVLAVSVPASGINWPGRGWPGIAMVLFLLTAGFVAVLLILRQANRTVDSVALPLPAVRSNAPAVAAQVAPPKPRILEVTNGFAVLPFKLEKTPGSSLVYITGAIRNQSDRQRFGVKVEFSLFDTNGNSIGMATDYQQLVDPHGEWRFKALVMESGAVSTRFGAILEDQ